MSPELQVIADIVLHAEEPMALCSGEAESLVANESWQRRFADATAAGRRSLRSAIRQVLETGIGDSADVGFINSDAALQSTSPIDCNPVFSKNGKIPVGVLLIARPLAPPGHSEREWSEREAELLGQLQHGVRNLLGKIRSIVRQSEELYETVDEYVAHLVGRLDALGRTQVLLSRAAGATIDLEGLVRDEFRAVAADEELFDLAGPEALLNAKEAEILTLALHELVSNSLKYGALQNGEGSITVTWSLECQEGNRWLTLDWWEMCQVVTPRLVHRGFGTKLIEGLIPYEMKGHGYLTVNQHRVEAQISFILAEGAKLGPS